MASASQPQATPETTGLPLSELLAGHIGKFPLDAALGILIDTSRILERAHSVGHVHASLSLESLWVSATGEIWIEWHPHRAPKNRGLAPELRSGEGPTLASDVYALGAVAYELLTGLNISRAWAKQPLVYLQDVASPRHFNRAVPVAVDETVSLSLSRHPADRPLRIETLAAVCEPLVVPGDRRSRLAAIVSDSFFAPALRELPPTCERARAVQPRPHPLPPESLLEQRWVQAEPNQTMRPELEDETVPERERPSRPPVMKIAIVSAIAAAASLLVCLAAAAGMASDQEGAGAVAGRSAALAPFLTHKKLGPQPPPPGVELTVRPVAVAEAASPVKVAKADRRGVEKRHGKRKVRSHEALLRAPEAQRSKSRLSAL